MFAYKGAITKLKMNMCAFLYLTEISRNYTAKKNKNPKQSEQFLDFIVPPILDHEFHSNTRKT